MRRLFSYLIRYRTRYAFGLLALFTTATIAMTIPVLLKRAVDTIEQGGSTSDVAFFCGVIVAFALVQGVVRTISRALIFNVGRDVEYDIRNDLFAHLETLSVSYYERQQTGDLMSRLVNDINAIRMMLGPGILNLVNTPVYYAYAVSIMVTIDPGLTALSLVAYPVVLLVVKRFSRQLMERMVKVQEGLSVLSSRIQENLSGMGVVKAYAMESAEIARFAELNRDFRDKSLELARARALIVPVMKVVSNAGILVVLAYGGRQVILGRMGIGDLVAFMAYLHLLAWPTMALGWMLSILQRGRAAMMRIEQIFAAEPDVTGPPPNGELAIDRGEIEFDHVSFAYPSRGGGTPVLDDVSFRVPGGSTVAIVGRTGSGKSTIAKLLPRLYDPTQGSIRIDGRDIRSVSLRTLRRGLGVVPQDPFLFSTTLRENIGYASVDQEASAIEGFAELASLEEDVDVLPRGFETAVGERGVTLSGGQKQRVTIARALAFDPRILVLDDALSSVDGETERRIRDRIREEFPNRTTLVISHRVATLQDADRILVLDGGRIVDVGHHEDLMRRSGLYVEMFRRQLLEAELEAM